jgi:hypothetical protein
VLTNDVVGRPGIYAISHLFVRRRVVRLRWAAGCGQALEPDTLARREPTPQVPQDAGLCNSDEGGRRESGGWVSHPARGATQRCSATSADNLAADLPAWIGSTSGGPSAQPKNNEAAGIHVRLSCKVTCNTLLTANYSGAENIWIRDILRLAEVYGELTIGRRILLQPNVIHQNRNALTTPEARRIVESSAPFNEVANPQ